MSIYKTDSGGVLTKMASRVDIVDEGTLRIDGTLFAAGSGGSGGGGGLVLTDGNGIIQKNFFVEEHSEDLEESWEAPFDCVVLDGLLSTSIASDLSVYLGEEATDLALYFKTNLQSDPTNIVNLQAVRASCQFQKNPLAMPNVILQKGQKLTAKRGVVHQKLKLWLHEVKSAGGGGESGGHLVVDPGREGPKWFQVDLVTPTSNPYQYDENLINSYVCLSVSCDCLVTDLNLGEIAYTTTENDSNAELERQVYIYNADPTGTAGHPWVDGEYTCIFSSRENLNDYSQSARSTGVFIHQKMSESQMNSSIVVKKGQGISLWAIRRKIVSSIAGSPYPTTIRITMSCKLVPLL